MAIVTTNVQPWMYVPDEDDIGWKPRPERILQLYGNTQITGYRHHPSIGSYPILNGAWACARSFGPYRGCFPGGFMERLETLLKIFSLIPDFDPNITKMFFPFGGSVIKKTNLDTLDIEPKTNPTYLGDVTDPEVAALVPDDYYDFMMIDPPYETVDWEAVVEMLKSLDPEKDDKEIAILLERLSKMFRVQTYSDRLYGSKPVGPYSFVSKNPKRVNLVPKVKIGGVIGIIHQLVYWTIPGCVRIGVVAVTTGPNMRIRALSLFIRVGEGLEKDFVRGESKLTLKTLAEVFGDEINDR